MHTDATPGSDISGIIQPLYQARFWMQLIGVMMILSGVISALTIIGIIVAWIPIWAGVVLMQAAGASQRAYQNNNAQEAAYTLSRLKIYFTIFGILLLIYVILISLGLLLGLGAGLLSLGSLGNFAG